MTPIGCSVVRVAMPVVVARLDDVAEIDVADAQPAVHGRRDGAVAEIGRGLFDGRLVLLDKRLGFLNRRPLIIRRLRRLELGGGELVVAGEVALRARQRRLVLGELAAILVERRLIGAGVDAGDHIAGLHVLPLGEVDGDDGAGDHRADGHCVGSLDRAEPGENDRHVLRLDRREGHRDRCIGGVSALVRRGRLCLGSAGQSPDPATHEGDEHEGDQPSNPGTPALRLGLGLGWLGRVGVRDWRAHGVGLMG